MNTVGVVFADFVTGPAGGPSQLTAPLAGRPTLARTLRRLMRVEGLARRCLFVRPRDTDVARAAVQAADLGTEIDVVPGDTAAHRRRRLHIAARKWNLASWRGGLLGACWFDEYVDPDAAALVMNHHECDALLCLDGHQAAFDAAIASAMVAQLEARIEETKIVFTQAPPGLAGVVLHRESLRELLEVNIPVGLLVSYRPEWAHPDPIIRAACRTLPAEVVQCQARFVGDTRRSRELLERAFADLGDDATAGQLCDWVARPEHDRAGSLPLEVELELTTADPLPDTTLRPRGARVPRRALTDLEAVRRLARRFAAYDDRLVVLGGHGDPLQHPDFAACCEILRSAGVFGLAVITPLVELPDAAFEALFAQRVDVLEVQIDAHTPETYRRVHNRDALGAVRANIARIEERRRTQAAPEPLVVCSLTRCEDTIHEMEAFYDYWIQEVGSATLRGYNDFCGRLAPDGLLSTTPAVRGPCRRLSSRLMLLADGTVAQCGQDVRGQVRLGDWRAEPLAEIWVGPELTRLREAQGQLNLESLPNCAACNTWNLP